MKHLLIIVLAVGGLLAFLNYDRIRPHLHLARAAVRAVQSKPAPETGSAPPPPVQTNSPAPANPASVPTNAAPANLTTNWSSDTAQHYARIIQKIRSTRDN